MRIKTITPLLKVFTAILMVLGSLTACDLETFDDAAGDFNSNSPAPPPPGSPPPPPPPGGFNPVYSEIQSNVLTPSCATVGCHDAVSAAEALNLEDANSFAEMVGIASSQDPNILRVAPNDPDNSYLIHKLEGTAATGAVMPPAGALDQATIANVRQWITDGALDDRVQPTSAVRVSSLSPAPGEALTAAPTQIVAGFDRQLDATSVTANTFIVEASGSDGIFDNGNETQITAAAITIPVGNTQSAVFDLTGVALADDTYRVSLLGTGATVIMDLDGNALDGETNAAFPSGDGNPGGVFEATFTVTAPVVVGPTLNEIQDQVFTLSCATVGCHSGGGAVLPTSMDLTNATASLAALVNIASQDPNFLRVLPGDANSSFLIQKLEGNQAVGGIMPPLPAQPLDPAVIASIRTWIDNGAQP